jgi:hypothetical protein
MTPFMWVFVAFWFVLTLVAGILANAESLKRSRDVEKGTCDKRKHP